MKYITPLLFGIAMLIATFFCYGFLKIHATQGCLQAAIHTFHGPTEDVSVPDETWFAYCMHVKGYKVPAFQK